MVGAREGGRAGELELTQLGSDVTDKASGSSSHQQTGQQKKSELDMNPVTFPPSGGSVSLLPKLASETRTGPVFSEALWGTNGRERAEEMKVVIHRSSLRGPGSHERVLGLEDERVRAGRGG